MQNWENSWPALTRGRVLVYNKRNKSKNKNMSFYKLFRDTASYFMAIVHLAVWFYFLKGFLGLYSLNESQGILDSIVALPWLYLMVYLVLCVIAIIFRLIEKYSAPTTVIEKFFNFYWYLSPALYFVITYLILAAFGAAWSGGGGGQMISYLFGGIMILMVVMDLTLSTRVILGFVRERKINLNWVAVVLCCLVVYLPAQITGQIQNNIIKGQKDASSSYISGIEKLLGENGFKTERQDYVTATSLVLNFDCAEPIQTSFSTNKQFGIIDQYLKNNGFARQLKMMEYSQRTIFSFEYNKCETDPKKIKDNYSDNDMNCSVEWRKNDFGSGCKMTISCNFRGHLDACMEKRVLKDFPTDITDFGKKLEEFVGDNIQTERCYAFEQKCIIEGEGSKIICIKYMDNNTLGRLRNFFTTNDYQIDASFSQAGVNGLEQCYRKGNIACFTSEGTGDVTCGRPQTQP